MDRWIEELQVAQMFKYVVYINKDLGFDTVLEVDEEEDFVRLQYESGAERLMKISTITELSMFERTREEQLAYKFTASILPASAQRFLK